jgi:tetratricopeptide (TPR) repeat protein
MSPEQAQMGEVDVDTRSDIYSLGVLLYELLTGGTPLEVKKLRSAAYAEMCRMIRETEPAKPSTRLNTLGEALWDVAKHRQAQPGELCKIIRGDLDWVVMKTLEKDRTRRYETANELAMDIERHLRDEPVAAGPPSTGYRLRKFVRRNRTGVLFALTVAAAVLIGLCLAIVEKERTKAALARAEDQRQRAEASLKLAQEAVEEMTRAADEQLSVAPVGPRARRLLHTAQAFHGRFLEERSDDPAAREQVGLAYKRLARIHEAQDDYEQAEQAYRQSINVFEKLAEDFPEDGRHQMLIVHMMDNWDGALRAPGRDEEADEIRSARPEKVKGLVRRFPHNSLYRKLLVEECRRQGSRQYYEEAIEQLEGLLAGHPSCRYELATVLAYFGAFLKDEGRPEEARQANQKAEAIRQELVAMLPKLPRETRRLHMPWPSTGGLGLADYEVRITQTGQYQLYVRSARHDRNSDWFYVWIDELADGPGGTVADWYMYETPETYADFAKPWRNEADFERANVKVRDEGPGVWQIAEPGDYTITFAPREDGVAIDAFVFQLTNLPAPDSDGPEESPMTKEKVFLESNGRVVAEAEHFADRTPSYCSWLVVPGEDAGDTAHVNFRGAGYVQALPDRSPSQGQWQILTERADTQSGLELWDKAIADYSEALAIMPDYVPALIGRGEAYHHLNQWNKAIADLSKAIELDPNSTDAWELRGLAREGLGQFDKAIADHSKAIEVGPRNAWAWHGRSSAYQQKRQWDKAIADCSKAIELEPDNPDHWHGRAEVYSGMKQWDKAIADYSKAVELEPDAWHTWEERFKVYQQLGQPDKALPAYDRAIELDPDNSYHWHRRADAYSNMQQWDNAIADYSKAIELNPSDSGHWHRRADTYSAMRQWDEAFADYAKAIEVDPNNPWAWHGRSSVYEQKRQWDKALADCSKAIELNPNHGGHWHRRADLYTNMKKWNEAIADHSRAIALEPDAWWIWERRFKAYMQLGQQEKGLADFSKAIELDPNNSNRWHFRANTYANLEQWDKAFADYSKAIELNPSNPHAWHGRSRVYQQKKQWDKALADCSKAIELDPDYSHHWHRRADVYWAMAQWDQALADLSKAVELNPNHAGHWHRRADVYSNMQQWDNAIADYSKAIELVPDAWWIWERRFKAYVQLGQQDKGLADYAKLIELKPRDPKVRVERGDCYYDHVKDYAKALQDYSAAIELDPNFTEAWYSRGLAHGALGQFDKAAFDFAEAVELGWNRAHNWYRKALAELGSGNVEKYRQSCATILERFGQTKEPYAAHWAAWTCVLAPNAVEDVGQAVKLAEQGAGRDDKSDRYVSTLGAILYRAGRFEQAVEQFSKLTDKWDAGKELPTRTSPAYTWFFMAMAHHRLGHPEEASTWLGKAVERAEKEIASDASWNRKLTLRLLRTEAESMIKPEEAEVEK